jgi:hypothetical protein
MSLINLVSLDISFALLFGKLFRTYSYPEDTIDTGCQVSLERH